MLSPIADGTAPDGGLLRRKKLPPAGAISAGVATLGLAAGVAAIILLTRTPRRVHAIVSRRRNGPADPYRG